MTKEMYKNVFKVNDTLKLRLTKGELDPDNVLVEYIVPIFKQDKEVEVELSELIWKIREVFDPKITLRQSNDQLKSKDTIGYMSAINHLVEAIYIDMTGKIHVKGSIKTDKKVVIPYSEFGKVIEVPTIDSVKNMINVISVMNRKNTMRCMDNNALFKISNLKDEDVETLIEILSCVKATATSILKERGVFKEVK